MNKPLDIQVGEIERQRRVLGIALMKKNRI